MNSHNSNSKNIRNNNNTKIGTIKRIGSFILSCTPISTIKNLGETYQGYDPITGRKINAQEKIRKTSSSIISILGRIRIGIIIQEEDHYIDPRIEIALRQLFGIGTQIIGIYHSGELQTIIKKYRSSIHHHTNHIINTGKNIPQQTKKK